MGRQKKNWSHKEIDKLKEFILRRRSVLENIFYQNIIAGNLGERKIPGFYLDMSKAVDRTASQCKSKFQKFERIIYTEYLGISEEYYRAFLYIRKKKKKQNQMKGECLPLKNTRNVELLKKKKLSEDIKMILPNKYLSKLEKNIDVKRNGSQLHDQEKRSKNHLENEEELEKIREDIIKLVETNKINCGISSCLIGNIYPIKCNHFRKNEI